MFFLLFGLFTGAIRLESVEETGNFLLDTMPLMFVPVTVSLMENYSILKAVALPVAVISVVSTVAVMAVTGKMTELLIAVMKRKTRKDHE